MTVPIPDTTVDVVVLGMESQLAGGECACCGCMPGKIAVRDLDG